jgi:hypothetical protein
MSCYQKHIVEKVGKDVEASPVGLKVAQVDWFHH